jgi:hypothetical protein
MLAPGRSHERAKEIVCPATARLLQQLSVARRRIVSIIVLVTEIGCDVRHWQSDLHRVPARVSRIR